MNIFLSWQERAVLDKSNGSEIASTIEKLLVIWEFMSFVSSNWALFFQDIKTYINYFSAKKTYCMNYFTLQKTNITKSSSLSTEHPINDIFYHIMCMCIPTFYTKRLDLKIVTLTPHVIVQCVLRALSDTYTVFIKPGIRKIQEWPLIFSSWNHWQHLWRRHLICLGEQGFHEGLTLLIMSYVCHAGTCGLVVKRWQSEVWVM